MSQIEIDRIKQLQAQSAKMEKRIEFLEKTNRSGCCCEFDDDGETVFSLCLAHKLYFERQK